LFQIATAVVEGCLRIGRDRLNDLVGDGCGYPLLGSEKMRDGAERGPRFLGDHRDCHSLEATLQEQPSRRYQDVGLANRRTGLHVTTPAEKLEYYSKPKSYTYEPPPYGPARRFLISRASKNINSETSDLER